MPIYEEKKKINGQKRYYIRTYVEDENGNKKQITRHNDEWIGKDGYWAAQAEELSLKKKKYNNYETMTLNELYQAYFNEATQTLKASSVRKIKDNYNLHIFPFFKNGEKKVFSLTTKDILEFHEYLNKKKNKITNKKSKRKEAEYFLSLRFKQSIHGTLYSILSFGCKYYNLNSNVASIVGNFKAPKGSAKKEMNYLTFEEFNNFIKQENAETYKDFFTILFFTGMRRGELLALTIDDIDFEKKYIKINKSINPKNGIDSTTPKTNKSNRSIYVLDRVYQVLLKFKEKNEKQLFGLDKIKPTTLQRKCDKNCKNANIDKNIRIHDFRHSFASMCIFNGIPIEIISEYLGHENISTTLNTYAHLYPNTQKKLVDALNLQDQKQDQA